MKKISFLMFSFFTASVYLSADTNGSVKPLLKDKSRYEKSVDKMLKEKQKDKNKTDEKYNIKRRKDGTIDTYRYFNK